MIDEKTFTELVRRRGSLVYKLAFIYMKSEFDADDVYQNVFERFLKYEPEFKNLDHEKNWFTVATINVCKSMKTAAWNRYNVTIDEVEWEKILSDASIEKMTESDSRVIEAVMQLEEQERLLIQLYYYEDYAVREIAKILGMKESTVYTKLNRARKKIEKNMTKRNGNRR